MQQSASDGTGHIQDQEKNLAHVLRLCDYGGQAVIEKASIDEVYMDVTTMVEKELRVSLRNLTICNV